MVSIRTDLSAIKKKMELARDSSSSWRMLSSKERVSYIKKVRKQLVEDLDEWVGLLESSLNKTRSDALSGDLLPVLDALQFYEKRAAKILKPQKARTPFHFFGGKSKVTYEPLGVVLIFGPWNFPMQLSLIPAISALLAGNAVLIKGSEEANPVNREIERLFKKAGLPEGVCQVVYGEKEEAREAIQLRPDKIFFTGSSAVGKKVLKQAAEQVIPCNVELSGKDPMIVLADANLERAARAAVWGAFMNSGQVCVGIERVYVHENIYEAFVEKVVHFTKELTGRDVKGMSTSRGWHSVKVQLEDAIEKGASIHTGGIPDDEEKPYFPPTVLTNVTGDMAVMKEETFGPLMPIVPFQTDEEAIRMANGSPYGLNASVFSADRKRAEHVAAKLETGNCFINDVLRNISNMHLPFGGIKESGFGRYHGAKGLYAFCNIKATMIKNGRREKELNWFPYTEQTVDGLRKFIKWKFR
ncbi:aldehyde dehydrogenase family protein [Pseudalkalibacillus caeni]|uniref:Aldehyde dehydrogenase n=1 Tax=Exobacillus caeni TaxID=2574798 RepID=A0A5R9F3C0_9BACL|nr:aldehyde dehydrogenase family protein [Pseudalkalibacillus caeni]TLS36078.1 aldehyde dehydrogenase family protein [Pseudalkalibacillus caeni]